jgi:hypothetical protein
VDGFSWDHSGAHGLAIYYPPTKSSGAYSRYPTRYQMSVDGTWDEFLNAILDEGDRRGMSAARAEDKLLGADAFIFRYSYLPLPLRIVFVKILSHTLVLIDGSLLTGNVLYYSPNRL